MNHHCSSSFDRISGLPSNITETILMFLPLRDMVRSSILSRHWRFQWKKVPQLVFNKDGLRQSQSPKRSHRYTTNVIYEVLLLHEGPILKFTLDMTSWRGDTMIDKIIPFLSRRRIQDMTISIKNGKCKKLPSSIFSCVELKHLSLKSCIFRSLNIRCFAKLVSLELLNVELDRVDALECGPLLESLTLYNVSRMDYFGIIAPNLKKLTFKGCLSYLGYMEIPRVKFLSLSGDQNCYPTGTYIDLIRFLRSLPRLENLFLDRTFLQRLGAGVSESENPAMMKNLKMLELTGINLGIPDHLSSTLWLIQNSSNLQNLKITEANTCLGGLVCMDLKHDLDFQMQKYSLLKLQKVAMILDNDWSSMRPDIEFLKSLLAISPQLEKLYIEHASKQIDVTGYKILLELSCCRRASPRAEIMFAGPV